MSTTDEVEKKQAANKLEEINRQNPQYIDLSEVHENDDLIALYKNCKRIEWTPSNDTGNNLQGHLQWNNIQPPSLQCGISEVYINFEAKFHLAVTGIDTDHLSEYQLDDIFNKIFVNDINAALYNTEVTLSTQGRTTQPYVNLAIKRLYDPEFFYPEIRRVFHDKNVLVDWRPDNSNGYYLYYVCSTPLLHPIFYADKDLAGINAFSVHSDYNLTNILNFKSIATTGAHATVGKITLTASNVKWKITYNQNNYRIPLSEYSTLVMDYKEFTNGVSPMTKPISFDHNIRDVSSAPIVQYLVLVNDPTIIKNEFNFAASTLVPTVITKVPSCRLNGLNISVNGNSNAYNTSSTSAIYHCCKKAGFLGSLNDFIDDYYPMVYGFSSLQYNNMVNSTDTYRFSVDSTSIEAGTEIKYSNYTCYCLYMYPALFFSGDNGNGGYVDSVAPRSVLIKSESDIDAYLKLLEQSGYSGGSLSTWLINLRDKLKRGRYISNAGKTIGRLMDSQVIKNVASMIPVVGPAIGANWDTAKGVINRATEAAENLGYGVKGEGIKMY